MSEDWDTPPDGGEPEGFTDQEGEIRATCAHCCDSAYWQTVYGAWAAWAHYCFCGPIGNDCNCEGIGG